MSGANPGIRVIEVDGARAFVTFGPESPVWRVHNVDVVAGAIPRGAFVRLEPPPTATDAEVAQVREGAVKSGAVRVQVLPRRRAAAVLTPKEKRPHRKVREVVAELLEEAPEEDRAALRTFVEAAMARRGL